MNARKYFGDFYLLELFAVFACAFLFLLFSMNAVINMHDEGIMLTGALRVISGDMLHRDFYANYGPAQFYIIGLLFKIFGPSVMVMRLYDMLIRALIVVVCYAFVSRLANRKQGFIIAVLTSIWLTHVVVHGKSFLPVILLSLAGSIHLITILLGQRESKKAFFTGIISGIATLFRYDCGVLLCAAHIGAVVIDACLRRESNRQRLSHIVSIALPYAAGMGLIIIPLAFWYMATGTGAAFFHDIIVFSTTAYAAFRGLPFPGLADCLQSPNKIIVYIPLLVTVLCMMLALKSKKTDILRISYIVFGLLTGAMFLKGIVRVSPSQMLLAIIPALLIFVVQRPHLGIRPRSIVCFSQIVTGLIMVSTLFAALLTAVELQKTKSAFGQVVFGSSRQYCTSPASERIRCFILDDNRINAAQYIMEHTRPDERIFIGLTRHDKIMISDVALYFVAGRSPATKWYQLDPGLQTRADIQTDMIKDIMSNNIQYMLLNSEWNDAREPNASAASSGVTLLDEYIKNNYRPVEQFGSLSVWKRLSHWK